MVRAAFDPALARLRLFRGQAALSVLKCCALNQLGGNTGFFPPEELYRLRLPLISFPQENFELLQCLRSKLLELGDGRHAFGVRRNCHDPVVTDCCAFLALLNREYPDGPDLHDEAREGGCIMHHHDVEWIAILRAGRREEAKIAGKDETSVQELGDTEHAQAD